VLFTNRGTFDKESNANGGPVIRPNSESTITVLSKTTIFNRKSPQERNPPVCADVRREAGCSARRLRAGGKGAGALIDMHTVVEF